ncbi:Cytochrome c heme lyase subunit CcmF [hydrothermal vent metagenome]|uniref:Cytochrome c heme lyase subunit CcmF n=1 Tax=hydrothermal vent metagenome TaxID=652676 RepID=A0A3B1BTU1_9ZZZZ
MTEIGEYSLILGLLVAIYATIASVLGEKLHIKEMVKSSEYALVSIFILHTVASTALMYALWTNDFSIEYVYSYTNRELGGFYRISAFWAGQKGSLLLWAWMLGLFATIVVWQNRNMNRKLMPYVVMIISMVLILFGLLMVIASPVFSKMPVVPQDGHGLNAMLQNPGMIFHPPSLYVGFVAFTIPFAFAMAALMSKQLGDIWIRTTRRWTIFAWIFLTYGNLLGANWAYVELGWGGYWAWDPVENASFMPWLTGTAFLHSVMVQEKKNMLKTWNMTLVSLTFILTLFGTFITRSGLISSVHSFGESTVGTYFGVFLLMTIAFSAYFIISRLPLLKSENQLDSMLSREASFLFNNLLFIGAAFAVFWGTMFPMISELVRGEKITVGPPFFNQVMVPIALALLLLTGICPMIAWRKASLKNFKRNFMTPLFVTLSGSILIVVAGVRDFLPWISFTICIFVAATIFMEVYRGVGARTSGGKENLLKATFNLFWKNKRRYGGYTIHAGVVMAFVGFTGTWFSLETEANLKPGEKIDISGYTLTYYKYDWARPKETLEEVTATLLVEKDGKKIGYVMPERNVHYMKDIRGNVQPQPVSEVAIHTTYTEDLYVIFAALNEDESATFKVHVNPLVKWLWLGGLLMGMGATLALWPDRKERERFEARHRAESLGL